MLTSRKFNPLVKEAQAGRAGEPRSNCKQAMICMNVDKHCTEGLKNKTHECRTKISLISQCKETYLYFPDKQHVKATRRTRAFCCDSDPSQLPSRDLYLPHQHNDMTGYSVER